MQRKRHSARRPSASPPSGRPSPAPPPDTHPAVSTCSHGVCGAASDTNCCRNSAAVMAPAWPGSPVLLRSAARRCACGKRERERQEVLAFVCDSSCCWMLLLLPHKARVHTCDLRVELFPVAMPQRQPPEGVSLQAIERCSTHAAATARRQCMTALKHAACNACMSPRHRERSMQRV